MLKTHQIFFRPHYPDEIWKPDNPGRFGIKFDKNPPLGIWRLNLPLVKATEGFHQARDIQGKSEQCGKSKYKFILENLYWNPIVFQVLFVNTIKIYIWQNFMKEYMTFYYRQASKETPLRWRPTHCKCNLLFRALIHYAWKRFVLLVPQYKANIFRVPCTKKA